MAEAQAGHSNAQQGEQQEEQQGEQQEGGEGGEQNEERQGAGRTYTQAELDRILGKVRKNARYLGRKEAEAELMSRGATRQEAEQAVDRQQQNQPKPAPKREDFENYEDFLVAKADHAARQASREEREASEKAASERTVTEQRQKTDREFKKHAEALMKEIPDFAEKVESAEDVMITPSMGEAIKEAGAIGPRILLHLIDNPEEAARISEIKSAAAQAREIGKIEARIEAELKAKAKPQGEEGEEDDKEQDGEEGDESEAEGKGKDGERNSDGTFKSAKKRAAPEPIEPGSARSATGSKTASDKDDVQTWMRKENERAAREGRR